jgi:membrane fusion protein
VDEKIETQLQLSIASLKQQRRQLESMGALERERIGEKIANTRSDIETLETEVAIQEKRALLLQEDMKGLQTLVDKKLVAEREQRQKQQELLQVQLAVKRLQRELETRRTELKTATLDLQRAPDDTAYRIAELNQNIARLQQQMIEVKAGRSTAIRAPVAGRVVTLLAEQGNEAQPERPVLKILPRGSQLEAELYVPPSAIGFVAEGHQVRIKYRAFPYQRFGTYAGRITHISDTSIAPGELITPVAINQSVYRIRVALQKQHIDAYGQSESHPLLPGMLVDAELLGSRLRIIEWLLEPIILVKGRFFS